MKSEIINRFSFHKSDTKGVEDILVEDILKIERNVRTLAQLIDELCPESKDKETALTQLYLAMMSAHGAIVERYPVDENDI